jgi:hypothetical protein
MWKWQKRLNERHMALVRRLLIVLATTILFFLAFRASIVTSQTATNQLQPGFNEALSTLQRAEAAGATSSELAPLVDLLNKALDLSNQANRLSAEDSQTRSQLQTQISDQLKSVETQAAQLENMASQRTFTNRVITYVSGGVGAVIGTLAYAYGTSFWRKYRVKRTFQMKISTK